jgi:HEAT repeat protein
MFDANQTDGNFKKGKLAPLAALGVIAALGIVGVSLMGVGAQQDAKKISPEEAAVEKQRILTLPKAEQVTQWRQFGKSQESKYLLEEALKNLAWARDPEGLDLAIASLKHPEQTVRAQAATALAEYGLPDAEKAKPALEQAFKEAAPESKPQIAWALIELKDSTVLQEVMAVYRAGHLAQVQKLSGAPAFNSEKLVALLGLDALAALHQDPSVSVRQLAATALSRSADKKYAPQLIALLKDADSEVRRQAAPGLGKIGDAEATAPLIAALKGADAEGRKAYLEALRDGMGARGLVLAFDTVVTDDKTRQWNQTEQIFKMIRKLADPSAADALFAYLDKANHIHWKFEVALALAELGDLRSVPTLAARLRMDEQKIYSDETDYEMMLKRDNKERVVAARMIADLAQIHKDELPRIRQDAEDALIFWLHERRAPHANGLRALAAMGSTADLAALRKWADPPKAMPLEGQQPPFPEEWEIAQSALRYLGWMKDPSSWSVLQKNLKRRPADLDATMEAMYGGGVAMLGMALRAVGVGAAQGFSEWGDRRAFPLLMDYIAEPKENEQSRMAACEALAWVANDQDMVTVAKKIGEYSSEDRKDQFRRSCLLEALIQRSVPGTSEALLTLLVPEAAFEVRHQIARAIGKAGVDAQVEAQLFEKVKNEQLANDAALALGLGAKPDSAARALAMLSGQARAATEELQELWFRSFGYWSYEDLDNGHLFRYVDNAEAMSLVEFGDTPQSWVSEQLKRQFDNLDFDNGPHSFTRVVLRYKLVQMAKSQDEAQRAGAIRTLKFMREQGVLYTLRDAGGPTGELAAEAYHELLHPLIATGVKEIKKDEED